MLNKVAKTWVEALRSGKFRQTRGKLGTTNGSRCCLGVLCDLAVKAKVIDKYSIYGGNLPPKVRDWVGLIQGYGQYTKQDGEITFLTQDNDTARKSFSQIADIIESEPTGLFETRRA